MIKIEEKTAKKVPGITSLFLEFKYHPSIVEVIKSCDGAQWDNKDKIWEAPILSLPTLIDHLSIIDEIDLHLLKDKAIKTISYEQDPADQYKLFKHQKEAIEFGLSRDRWLLLDAPGLGKTNSIIKLAEELKKRDNIEHCLIICGINTLKYNWKKEINKFSQLTVRVLGEHITKSGKIMSKSIPDCIKELNEKIDEFFVIINIEKLRDENLLKALMKNKVNKFDMIAFDELQACKSPNSSQGANLLKIKAKYQVGATGTMILNSPEDCYVPLKWIGFEHSTFSKFKYYYLEYGGPFGNMLVGFKNTELLKKQIEQVSLRRTKDLLDLPPKNIIDEYVQMDTPQQNFYDNIKDGIVDQVDKVKMHTANLLAMVTRLRQATEFPQLLTSDKNIKSAKIERCLDLVDQILSDPNEKVVIFSCYKEPCKHVFDQLKKYKPLLCTGDVPDATISHSIDVFQNDNEHRVMVCTGQKMGTGITLNRAHYAIFLSTPWTAGVNIQWQDRIHRIGTREPVFIYNLWTLGTIDERVKELIDTKGALSDYVIDDQLTENNIDILRKYIEELRN